MVRNDWFLQFLADVLGVTIERPVNVESTVLGAAYLAAYGAGVLQDSGQLSDYWRCEARFEPAMSADRRSYLLEAWASAVGRVKSDGN